MSRCSAAAAWMTAIAFVAGLAVSLRAARADEPTAKPDVQPATRTAVAPAEPSQLGRWIEQLGDDDFALREQAMERLTAAGAAAIEPLSAATRSESAEIAWRAGEVLERIGISGDEQTVDQVCRAMEKLGAESERFGRVAGELRTRWREVRHAGAAARLQKLGAELQEYSDSFGYSSAFGPVFISPSIPPPFIETTEAELYTAPLIDTDVADIAEATGTESPALRLFKVETAEPSTKDVTPPLRVADPPVAEPAAVGPPPADAAPDFDPFDVPASDFDPFDAPAERKPEHPAEAPPSAQDTPPEPAASAAPVFGETAEPADLKPLIDLIGETERVSEPAVALPADDLPGTTEKTPSTLEEAALDDVSTDLVIALDEAVSYDPFVVSGPGLYGAGFGGGFEATERHRSLKLGPAFKGSDADLEALAALQSVAVLEITRRRVTDAALEQIARMADLKLLTLRHSEYDRKSVMRFKQRRPEVAVQAFGDAILGISGQPGGEGFLVGTVVDGSGAAKAGLLVGDVIRRIDGEPIPDFDMLSLVVSAHKPGDRVTVEVVRDGKLQTFQATLGKRD